MVVLLAPGSQSTPDIVQRSEPARVEALVAQPTVEALDVSVLHRAARLDVHQAYLEVLRPADHAPRGELRPVVRAHRLGPAALGDQPLQHAGHPARAKAGVGLQRQALARVRIDHAQDAHHPPGRQAVDDEVHRPLLVRPGQPSLRSAVAHQPLAPLAAYSQTLFHIQPVDPLHVHLMASTAQQRVQPTVAVTRLLPCQLQQLTS